MNIYERAIRYYGKRNQATKAIEELAELQQALSKHLLRLDNNVEEEIADVKIMIEQLEMIFDKAEIDKIMNEKLIRLEKRINNE